MTKLFEKYPWLKSVGCGVLVVALVLSICLPLLGMRSAEPDNPILQAEPQEITVLQAGSPRRRGQRRRRGNLRLRRTATPRVTSPATSSSPTPTRRTTNPVKTRRETIPQDQPTQPDYSEADIGTNTDSIRATTAKKRATRGNG